MLSDIHFTKALLLVSIMVLAAVFTFDKIIRHNRLEVFREYSDIILPPDYTISQNTAGAGSNNTDVLLAFSFDEKNYEAFLRLNKIKNSAFNRQRQNKWKENEVYFFRRKIIYPNTIISERINKRLKMLEFHYQKK